jgi:hypothetical protein
MEKLTFLHKILPAASVAAPPGSPLTQLDVWQVVGGAPPRGGALVTEEGGRREVRGCMSARRPAHLSPATAEEGQDAIPASPSFVSPMPSAGGELVAPIAITSVSLPMQPAPPPRKRANTFS